MNITVLEHEKIKISSTRNEAKKQISRRDAELLKNIEIKNPGIFKWGYDYVQPQQWIGVISTGNFNLEILPKVSNSYDEDRIRRILLYMFQKAYDIPVKSEINSNIKFGKDGLVELLIFNFLMKLEDYIRSGLIFEYKKETKNLHVVKGTIDFTEQINRNILNPTRFYCKFSKLVIDNNINRIIKLTLMNMSKLTKNTYNSNMIRNVLPIFSSVNINDNYIINTQKIYFNRLNYRVKDLIEYCELFMGGYSIHLTTGNNKLRSVLFDMNRLFEKFIFNYCRKVFKGKVSYQNSNHYLIEDVMGNKKRIKLRPDILINFDKGYKIVVDTKWKVVERFAKETDVYQMNAYVTAIPQVNNIVLLYPYVKSIEHALGNYKFINDSRNEKKLKIRAVDMDKIGDEKQFEDHIRELLES